MRGFERRGAGGKDGDHKSEDLRWTCVSTGTEKGQFRAYRTTAKKGTDKFMRASQLIRHTHTVMYCRLTHLLDMHMLEIAKFETYASLCSPRMMLSLEKQYIKTFTHTHTHTVLITYMYIFLSELQ